MPIVKAIRSARRKIDVFIFRADRGEIGQALAQAVLRGVTVRALIAHTNGGGEGRLRKLEQRLLESGVLVSRTSGDLTRYHAKYMIADAILYLFGFNFTRTDIDKSRSFAIATRDAGTVAEALRLFESDVLRQPYEPGASNLVISPDNARAALSAFIKGARRELAIYDARIQDPAMIELLKERASGGVAVRVLGSVKGKNGGIDAREPAMRTHVRAMIRDGTRAFVGSQSLRREELEQRREVGLIINNPTVARKLLQVFEADWAMSDKKAKAA